MKTNKRFLDGVSVTNSASERGLSARTALWSASRGLITRAPAVMFVCWFGLYITAFAQQPNVTEKKQFDTSERKQLGEPPAKPADTLRPEEAKPTEPATLPARKSEDPSAKNNGEGLRLNFRDVPLEMVLNYLSDAAGFIIILETKPEGKVTAWSNQPLSKDEAVDLLNTILNKNGYAAIRNGRTLSIVAREEAKKRNIPVEVAEKADAIPKSDEMVTEIIPVRHANVTQLIANLQPLLGTYAEMSPNESANSLVLTATKADVRRMTEIINALDESISGTSTIRVFPLKFADAKELANVIKELFAPTTQQQGGNRGNFGGFGGGGFGGGGQGGFGGGQGGFGGGQAGRGNRNATTAANTRVVAVADERSNSLVVGGPDDMMGSIEDMIKKIDQPVSNVTELRVFHLVNSDPLEMADLFGQLFPDESRSDQTQNQQSFRFNRGGPGGFFGGPGFGGFNRGGNNSQSGASSERMRKMGRVIAVPDQRTSSLIVSAAAELMPQIADMIDQLDSSRRGKQRVYVYSLENADPQQVEQILKGMFERTTTQNYRNTRNQNSALSTRGSANQGTTTGSGFGNGGFGNSGFGNQGGGFGGGGGFNR